MDKRNRIVRWALTGRKIALLGIAVWAVAGGPTAWAQDRSQVPEGVTVLGVGVAKGMPDLARIEVRMEGKAEITDDALVKYQAAHKRLTEALENLKLDNLKVSERDLALSSGGGSANAQMMMGNAGGESTSSTEISGVLRADLTNLQGTPREDIWKTIGKVLDAIRDAGGSVGPSSADMQMAWRWGMMPEAGTSVKFVVSDLKPLREQSYDRALTDARTRGERLAKLGGIKLGRVMAVQDLQTATNHPARRQSPYFWFNNQQENDSPDDPDEIEVEKLAEVPLTVQLLVRFEIAPGSENPPAGSATRPADAKVSTQ